MEKEIRPKQLERMEGKVYETKMSLFLANMLARINDVEDPKRREILKRTVRDVESAMYRYITTRIGLAAIRAIKTLETSSYGRISDGSRQALEEADASRRRAHLALVDSINVAARNILKESEDTLPGEFHGLVGDSNDEFVRESVATATLDYVYKILDEEDWNQRFKTAKPKEEGTI